jgi:hypothetical protein
VRLDLRQEDRIVRFITNEDVIRLYEEEARRNGRQDTRSDEEIERDERTVEISANINMIIENLGSLAGSASNVVTSNIDWNPNAHFELLRNIFGNLDMG